MQAETEVRVRQAQYLGLQLLTLAVVVGREQRAGQQVLEDLGSEALVVRELLVVQLLTQIRVVAVVEGREQQQVLEVRGLPGL